MRWVEKTTCHLGITEDTSCLDAYLLFFGSIVLLQILPWESSPFGEYVWSFFQPLNKINKQIQEGTMGRTVSLPTWIP